MTATGPRAIGVVVEAPADAETARTLVDRVLRSTRDWLTDDLIDTVRSWRGIDPSSSVSYWKDVRGLAKAHGVQGVKVHGRFGDEPRAPDAYAARRALVLFARLGMPEAVVLVRDADDQPERLAGLAQGRMLCAHPECVVIGVANPEREAWHLAGFSPESPQEHEALRAERKRLGFDPTHDSHRLRGEGKRNAKPVLQGLTEGDHDRARRCLTEPSLEGLEARGADNGLADFIHEVRERLVPIIV